MSPFFLYFLLSNWLKQFNTHYFLIFLRHTHTHSPPPTHTHTHTHFLSLSLSVTHSPSHPLTLLHSLSHTLSLSHPHYLAYNKCTYRQGPVRAASRLWIRAVRLSTKLTVRYLLFFSFCTQSIFFFRFIFSFSFSFFLRIFFSMFLTLFFILFLIFNF